MRALAAPAPPMPKTGIAAILFGLVTILTGGAALFTRLDMGHVVAFVLWFNFLAGFVYVAAGVLIHRGRPGATALAALLALSSLLVFAAFGAHVSAGSAYEARTMGAMALRSGFWIAVAAMLQKASGASAP